MRSAGGGRSNALASVGLHVTFLSLRDMQEWLRRIRRRREQGRFEARKEKLRRSIGDRVIADHNAPVG